MFTVGLTGGIGSGKSTVAKVFSSLEIPVIDADQMAREVVEPEHPALKEIVLRFGEEVLTPEGKLDRRALREIIFADKTAKADLESILHPRIRERMWALASEQSAPYVLLEIPLLIETGQDSEVDRVLVVDISELRQIEYVCRRDNITEDEAQSIIDSQLPREKRLNSADDIIVNNGSIRDLHNQVEKLHHKYLALASHKSA